MALLTIPPAEAPVGYPFEFERVITLGDGSVARVRPVVPKDVELLAEEIAQADEETLYLRFFTPVVRLDDERLHYLTELDYHRRFAVAAFTAAGDGIGIARYEGTGEPGEAEIAVTVKAGYRRLGVASRLFAILEEAGRANGLTRFVANYLAENDPAEALMESAGYGDKTISGGIATVTKDL